MSLGRSSGKSVSVEKWPGLDTEQTAPETKGEPANKEPEGSPSPGKTPTWPGLTVTAEPGIKYRISHFE